MLSTEKILDSCFDKEYTTWGFQQGATRKEGSMPPRAKSTKGSSRREPLLLPPPPPDTPPMGGPSGAGYAAEARFAFYQRSQNGHNGSAPRRRKSKSRKR